MISTMTLLSLLCGTPALAASSAQTDEATSTQGDGEHDSGVSVRVLSGRTWLDTDSAPLIGFGLALEHEFFDGQLIVEVAGEWLHDPDRNAGLFEALAEHGIPITDRTSIVVGAGPVFAAALEHNPAWGGLAVIALETELAPRLQLFVELDGAVLFDPEVVLETDLGTGVMWSF
jgi:hypothetical protein